MSPYTWIDNLPPLPPLPTGGRRHAVIVSKPKESDDKDSAKSTNVADESNESERPGGERS